jgi:hypothetical protein
MRHTDPTQDRPGRLKWLSRLLGGAGLACQAVSIPLGAGPALLYAWGFMLRGLAEEIERDAARGRK